MSMMPTVRVIVLCWLSLAIGLVVVEPASAQDEFRHWTMKTGKRSDIRLKLVEAKSGAVQLQREDNDKIITLRVSALSAEDRVFLKSLEPSASSNAMSEMVTAGDWPQWRGPNRDGKSPAAGLFSEWPSSGPELVWNVTGLGEGYSTPAVIGETIYLLGSKEDDEFVFALRADDGSQLWESRVGTKSEGGGFKGPKGTPTIDGDKIYALGSDGALVCVQRSDGQLVWRKNMKRDFGGQHGAWHYAESPLIDGDKLVCTPGGRSSSLVALNKSDGSTIWKSPIGTVVNEDFAKAGYASVISAKIKGLPQYVAFLHGGVVGVSAKDGKPLWHYDAPANGTANCSTPVVLGDSVFAASGYGTGGGRAEILRQGTNWNVREAYFVEKMESHHGGFVLHDGHIYGTNNSVLLCLNWKNGKIMWQDRCVGKGSVSLADGHLYVRGEKGGVALVEATPAGYREKGRFDQPDRSGKNAWAHPVVAGGRLYLHDQDRLLCYRVK